MAVKRWSTYGVSGWRSVAMMGVALAASVPVMVGLAGPTGAGAVYCTDSSPACMIAAGTSYLDALVSHNSSHVQLAPDAIRTENGVDTGNSGPQIAKDLATNPQYLVVHDIRDVQWYVAGDDAIAFYLLDVTVPVVGTHVATTHLSERFEVQDGLITQIEAIDCTHPGLTPESARMSTPESLVTEQCVGSEL